MELTVKVTEKDLLNLPNYIDDLMMKDSSIKNAGYVKFDIENRRGGTSLQEFLAKFERSCGPSPKRVCPISLPMDDIYGHITIEESYLGDEDVAHFKEVMRNPSSYTPTSDNCCMAALNEEGYEGLLDHYFDNEFPQNCQPPALFCPKRPLKNIKLAAAAKKKKFSQLHNNLASLSEAEQGAELQSILDSSKRRRIEKKEESCNCELCIHSDECFKAEQPDDLEYREKHTAAYYKKGFLYGNCGDVKSEDRNLITTNFSLSYLDLISLTGMFEKFFPGVNTPYLYAGSLHSFCPIHVEDLSLFSVNFLHYGHPKLWIIVCPSAVARLTYAIIQDVEHSGSCLGILNHKYHFVTVSWLKKHRIPFSVVVQREGQGVIVTPNAAHLVVNLGPNIAEAMNFGTVSWIPYAIASVKCHCFSGQVHEDISPIIQSFCPGLLPTYLNREVPKEVPNDPEFQKCVICPILRDEMAELQKARDYDVEVTHPVSESLPTVKETDNNVIECPVCGKTYKGGHKARLLSHIEYRHRNLPDKEQADLDCRLEQMFPERKRMPRVPCDVCGKSFAGSSSLKRHVIKSH